MTEQNGEIAQNPEQVAQTPTEASNKFMARLKEEGGSAGMAAINAFNTMWFGTQAIAEAQLDSGHPLLSGIIAGISGTLFVKEALEPVAREFKAQGKNKK